MILILRWNAVSKQHGYSSTYSVQLQHKSSTLLAPGLLRMQYDSSAYCWQYRSSALAARIQRTSSTAGSTDPARQQYRFSAPAVCLAVRIQRASSMDPAHLQYCWQYRSSALAARIQRTSSMPGSTDPARQQYGSSAPAVCLAVRIWTSVPSHLIQMISET